MSPEIITSVYIFFARILDVSLGTIRIILISRGFKHLAPLVGFFEVLIWLTAISKAMANLNNISSYIIYAGGFATGNYVGMLLESKIPFGYQAVRIIAKKRATGIANILREEGYLVTTVQGSSNNGEVTILYLELPKTQTRTVIDLVRQYHTRAFITIEDIKNYYTSSSIKRNFMDIFGRQVQKKK